MEPASFFLFFFNHRASTFLHVCGVLQTAPTCHRVSEEALVGEPGGLRLDLEDQRRGGEWAGRVDNMEERVNRRRLLLRLRLRLLLHHGGSAFVLVP